MAASASPASASPASPPRPLSLFESIITSYPPVLESVLAQLPTHALLNLYHSSPHLRAFLTHYPLAWKTLSFRLPQPALALGSPGSDTPDAQHAHAHANARHSKHYALDALLKHLLEPSAARITNLDLCNTAVNGVALVATVLAPHMHTLHHLSVRGCKNVSIKYHIVPFLEPYTLDHAPWSTTQLALKSLYTYRCRHHRRRPYLPSSLLRRDSDSDPTHQLIDICHQLAIWTDTAWCPSPAARCYRRKDYHAGRAAPQNMEVWVPFDRLWRSGNRIGPVHATTPLGPHDGRLWEIADHGQDGEPLGTGDAPFAGEGKHVPAHARKSHTTFVDNIKCDQCHHVILERCESCSVRMHCMGCRKTLCPSCAFNRPMPRNRAKTRHFTTLAFGNPMATLGHPSASTTPVHASKQDDKPDKNRFWWAPGATRSPNLMTETAHDDDDDSSDSEDALNPLPAPPAHRDPPKLNMHWCCLEPIFSGGGGIAVLGTGLGGRGADKIRAAPLPRTKHYQDPDFSNQLRPVDYIRELKNNGLYEYVLGEDVDVLHYLKQDSLELQQHTCPRALCTDCYRSFRWKVSCRACKSPICKEHDFGALKVRKCGYRDLRTERDHVRAHAEPPHQLVIPDFNPQKPADHLERTPTASSQLDAVSTADNESESSEGTPMSQSQVLVADMATSSNLGTSNLATTPDPLTLTTSLSFVPVSSSRPRSLSASGVCTRNSVSWTTSPRGAPPPSISNPLPLPCHSRNHPVQWEGCGAYFCQYPRPVGDNRPQCPANLKECSECTVLVCDACSSLNPSCTCTFCTVNFHCPVCTRKPLVRSKCRLEAELQAKRDAELRAKDRIERDRAERGQADELAGAVNEFFTALYTDTDAPAPGGESYMASFTDFPLSSPDSITVTTEFGVLEETGNVTIISAGGGPHPYDQAEADDQADEHEEGHDDPENYVIHTEDTSAPTTAPSSTDWVTAVALQHQQEHNMWLLQQQMQSIYLNQGNNTTPPPMQHTAALVHQEGGHHQEGDTGEASGDDGDGDGDGDMADVDTDEVLDGELPAH